MPFLLLALLAALQQTATPLGPVAQAASAPTPVHFVDLHLSFEIPAGLAMDPGLAAAALKTESDQASGAEKATLACVTSPVVAADPTDNFRMIIVIKIDFACLGKPVSEDALSTIVTSTLTESLHRFGNGVLTAPVRYNVGEYPAAFVRGSVKSEKFSTTFHASASCVLVDKTKMGCWEFVGLSPAAVDKLAATPLHFDGHDPVALVPADIAAKGK